MKVIRSTTTKAGKTRLTIEIDAGEQVVGINEDRAYRMVEPMDDVVVFGRHLINVEPVCWCVIEQKWVS